MMIKTELKITNESEMRTTEKKLNETGYAKTADCMWAKIYTKGNIEIILNREW